jgi:hypothetical protein
MEPDPSVFLRAIRREALSNELFEAGIVSGASPVIMYRAGEGLAQLVLRYEKLPAVLRAIRPRQVKLLRDIAQCLDGWGVSPPREITRAVEATETAASRAGEEDIFVHDRLADGLAAGIRTLRSLSNLTAKHAEIMGDLCQAASQIEHEWRREYNRILASLKNEDHGEIAPAALPTPTAAELTDCLREHFPDELTIAASNVQRLAGFNSKDIFVFEVSNSQTRNGQYVMRREPANNVTQSSLASEFDLLLYLKRAGLPVPRVLCAEASPRRFGGEFLVMERVPGAPRSPETLRLRSKEITLEVAQFAAQIHALEIPKDLPRFADIALSPRDRMLANVERYYQRWIAGVPSQGHVFKSVKVRPRLKDSDLVAWEAPWRETKTVEPSDNML